MLKVPVVAAGASGADVSSLKSPVLGEELSKGTGRQLAAALAMGVLNSGKHRA